MRLAIHKFGYRYVECIQWKDRNFQECFSFLEERTPPRSSIEMVGDELVFPGNEAYLYVKNGDWILYNFERRVISNEEFRANYTIVMVANQ
jgi:hypothetical protein